MPPKPKTFSLRFPSLGVVRRQVHERVASAVSYPSPWALNCRLVDSIAHRLRGGSRQGLTKLISDNFGNAFVDMVPITVSSAASGTEELLVALSASAWKVVDDGVLDTGSAAAPNSGFLVTGQQHVFAVYPAGTSSRIAKFEPKNRVALPVIASAGTVPTGCTIGAVYGDRLFLAGGDNAIYASRKGDFTDWGFSVDVSDAGRALTFQLAGDSDVGDTCTALIPHRDNFMLAATARTLWLVRSDPGVGGLEQVSDSVGIIAGRAWCKVGDGIVFLAEDGLYQVAANGSGLKSLTEDRIPEELRDIDTDTVTPMLGYDHDGRAIHIYLPTDSGGDTHWLFELENESLWPAYLQGVHQPVAVCNYEGDLLLAGEDGYVRKCAGSDDDGEDIESHVLLGPLRLGDAHNKGLIQTIIGIMGASSGTVTWRIIGGNTAEEACDNGKAAIAAVFANRILTEDGLPLLDEDDEPILDEAYDSSVLDGYVDSSGSWDAGRSNTAWPRVRTAWAVLWLSSSDSWAFESVLMEAIPFGRHRT